MNWSDVTLGLLPKRKIRFIGTPTEVLPETTPPNSPASSMLPKEYVKAKTPSIANPIPQKMEKPYAIQHCLLKKLVEAQPVQPVDDSCHRSLMACWRSSLPASFTNMNTFSLSAG